MQFRGGNLHHLRLLRWRFSLEFHIRTAGEMTANSGRTVCRDA
jgi:hypothetical protein